MEPAQGLRADCHARPAVDLGRGGEEVVDEGGDVSRPLAQRRHVERDEVQPVEQVLPELAARHERGQVTVGGGHDAHVDAARHARAERLVAAVLEDPQHLDLAARLQLPDLVEEDRAARGNLEPPLAVAAGVREGPLHVPEHLALEEGRGDAPQVDLDEGPFVAARVAVEGLGDELLACPALPGDEHRGVRRRDPGHDVQHLQQARVAPDDAGEVVGCVQLVSRGQGALAPAARLLQAQRGLDRLQELGVRPGLGDEVGRPRLHALDGEADRAPGGHEHDRELRPARLDVGQQRQALRARGLAREVHVLEHQGEAPALQQGERLRRAHRRPRGMSGLLEEQGHRRRDGDVVVDDQDARHGAHILGALLVDARGRRRLARLVPGCSGVSRREGGPAS
jgi:hypothetical protein